MNICIVVMVKTKKGVRLKDLTPFKYVSFKVNLVICFCYLDTV